MAAKRTTKPKPKKRRSAAKPTGNSGEWSESVACLQALAQKILDGLEIGEIIQGPTSKRPLTYQLRSDGGVEIILDGTVVQVLTRMELLRALRQMKEQIKLGRKKKKGAFAISVPALSPEVLKAMRKATSAGKADVSILFKGATRYETYSVKSYLGGNPTLLNASLPGRVRFKITGDVDCAAIIAAAGYDKATVAQRLEAVVEAGGKISPDGYINPIFESNLAMIHPLLPKVWPFVLLLRDWEGTKHLPQIAKSLTLIPEGFDRVLRDLLVATTCDFQVATPWDGLPSDAVTGGLLTVLADGKLEVVHPNDMGEHLLARAYMEKPDHGRHKSGDLYEIDGCYYIDLVGQIRVRRNAWAA